MQIFDTISLFERVLHLNLFFRYRRMGHFGTKSRKMANPLRGDHTSTSFSSDFAAYMQECHEGDEIDHELLREWMLLCSDHPPDLVPETHKSEVS